MKNLVFKGDWSTVMDKLRVKWDTLTDEDLQYSEGKQEVLLGRIQRCTGETRATIVDAVTTACSSY